MLRGYQTSVLAIRRVSYRACWPKRIPNSSILSPLFRLEVPNGAFLPRRHRPTRQQRAGAPIRAPKTTRERGSTRPCDNAKKSAAARGGILPVDFALCGIRAPLATGSRSPDVLCQREALVQSFVFSSEEPATRSSGRENAPKPSIDRQNDPSGCGLRAADCGLRAEGCGAISFRERKRVTSGSAPRGGGIARGAAMGKTRPFGGRGTKGPPELIVKTRRGTVGRILADAWSREACRAPRHLSPVSRGRAQ